MKRKLKTRKHEVTFYKIGNDSKTRVVTGFLKIVRCKFYLDIHGTFMSLYNVDTCVSYTGRFDHVSSM